MKERVLGSLWPARNRASGPFGLALLIGVVVFDSALAAFDAFDDSTWLLVFFALVTIPLVVAAARQLYAVYESVPPVGAAAYAVCTNVLGVVSLTFAVIAVVVLAGLFWTGGLDRPPTAVAVAKSTVKPVEVRVSVAPCAACAERSRSSAEKKGAQSNTGKDAPEGKKGETGSEKPATTEEPATVTSPEPPASNSGGSKENASKGSVSGQRTARLLWLSGMLSALGASIFCLRRTRTEFEDGDVLRPFTEFEKRRFWSGLWFRVAEAVVFTLVVFFLLWGGEFGGVSAKGRVTMWSVPVLGLFVGLFVKSAENLVAALADRSFAALQALFGATPRPATAAKVPEELRAKIEAFYLETLKGLGVEKELLSLRISRLAAGAAPAVALVTITKAGEISDEAWAKLEEEFTVKAKDPALFSEAARVRFQVLKPS